MIGVAEAGSDPESEEVGGVEVGVVEGIDVGAQAFAEGVGQFVLIEKAAMASRCGRSGARPRDSMVDSSMKEL